MSFCREVPIQEEQCMQSSKSQKWTKMAVPVLLNKHTLLLKVLFGSAFFSVVLILMAGLRLQDIDVLHQRVTKQASTFEEIVMKTERIFNVLLKVP